MNLSSNAKIKCPFYLTQSEKILTCEGFFENSLIKMHFLNENEKNKYEKKYCNDWEYGEKCFIAAKLLTKY